MNHLLQSGALCLLNSSRGKPTVNQLYLSPVVTTIITQNDYKLYTEREVNSEQTRKKRTIKRSRGGDSREYLSYKKINVNSSVAKLFHSFANIQWQRQKATKKGIFFFKKGIYNKVKPHVYLTIYFLECIFLYILEIFRNKKNF